MLAKFQNTKFLKTILALYWLAVGLLFLIYSYLDSLQKAVQFTDFLQSDARGVITFLLGCVYILQFFIFWSIHSKTFSKTNIFGISLLIFGVQQLLLYNVLGTLICVVLYYFLPNRLNNINTAKNTAFIITLIVLVILSVLIVFLRINIR